VTQKMKSAILQKEDHYVRDCGLFKEWLQKIEFQDIDPRKK
jgi:hypothetical protein